MENKDIVYPYKDWDGIVNLGEVDGVTIYYDMYHPDQTLTVELNKDKTEMVYIIGPYDDIAVFDGIKKNIIVSEKPITLEKIITNDWQKYDLKGEEFIKPISPTYSIPIYENGIKTEWSVDGIVGDDKYFKLLALGNGKDLPDMINTNTKK